jgi:hypothetical protein
MVVVKEVVKNCFDANGAKKIAIPVPTTTIGKNGNTEI